MFTLVRPSAKTLGFLFAALALAALVATAPYAQRRDREQEAALDEVKALRRSPLLRLLVPMYLFPDEKGEPAWAALKEAGRRVPITAVVNVQSGPDRQVEPNHARKIREITRAGIEAIGYVYSDYGKRPEGEILADFEAWFRLYPEIGGIFLDAQSTDAKHLAFYANLRKALARTHPTAILISNPGTLCDTSYFEKSTSDAACVFELNHGFEKFELPWNKYPRTRFAALPYNVGDVGVMKQYLSHAVKIGVGMIYVTDASAAEQWTRLPLYWDKEVEAVYRINHHQAP